MGHPPRDNAAYREFFSTQIMPFFQDFKARNSSNSASSRVLTPEQVDVEILVVDPESRKSVFHGFAIGNLITRPWSVELRMVMSFDETGEKVVEMKEMFDSAVFIQLFTDIKQRMDVDIEGKAQ